MNPMKVLGGYGEAGTVVTDNEDIYNRLKRLRHAGTTSDPKNRITNDCLEVSLNHKMDTINAALLLVEHKHFQEKQKKREAVFKRYDAELPSELICQGYHSGEIHGRYVYALKSDIRNKLKTFLEKNKIETKIMHEPLASDAPVYRHLNSHPTPVARKLLSKSLIIPAHEKLTEKQVNYVIEVFHKIYN